MALVTIELRNCLKINEFDLFDFSYSCEDVTWKEELEADIINYFFFHEIGQETIERFKQRFSSRMKLIMPYYNELFKSKLMVLDPLLTQHIEETLQDNSSIVSSADSESGTVFTEYPEHTSMVDNIPANKSEGESLSNQNTSTVHDYNKIIKGFSGMNVSELLSSYRKTIINVNQMIIDDLKQCFILIY